MIPQHPLPPNGLVGKQISVSDRILTRVVTGTHRRLLRLTGGRLMNSMNGNRVRILAVVGRKTGRPGGKVRGIPVSIAGGPVYLGQQGCLAAWFSAPAASGPGRRG